MNIPGLALAPTALTALLVVSGAAHAQPRQQLEQQQIGRTTDSVTEFSAADPSSPEVTAENLFEQESFWPYQVMLTEEFHPEGAERPFKRRHVAVLVRVEPSGLLRMDFADKGRHRVPLEKTNALEMANQIRTGVEPKLGPNYVLAIGPRLIDPSREPLLPFSLDDTYAAHLFLNVYLDPDQPGFEEIAKALAPISARPGLQTVLFPQGRHRGVKLAKRLRELGWTVPFLYDPYSEPYTRSRLGDDEPMPALTVETPNGRLLFKQAWGPAVVPSLSALLDEALPPGTATADAESADSPTTP